MLFQIADIILILHFGIILFITSLFFLIPVGYKFNWIFKKYKNKNFSCWANDLCYN